MRAYRSSRCRFRIPLPIRLLFPDLDVLALISCRLAAGVVHGDLIGATNETKIPGFCDLDFSGFPTDDETGAGEKIASKLLDRFFSRRDRRVWRQDAGVGGIIRHGFVEVFAGRGLRPGVIGVTKRLFGFGVAGQADGRCGEAERESE